MQAIAIISFPLGQHGKAAGSPEATLLVQEGLLVRFRLLRLLPLALLNMTVGEVPRRPSPPPPPVGPWTLQLGSEPGGVPRRQSLAEADKLLKACEALVERLGPTASVGEGEAFGFEAGVGAPLLPPTFPRKARIYNRVEVDLSTWLSRNSKQEGLKAFAYLGALVQRLLLIVVLLPQQAASFGTALVTFSIKARFHGSNGFV